MTADPGTPTGGVRLAFDKWWGELTRRGDPARRPYLTHEAFKAGYEAGQRQGWADVQNGISEALNSGDGSYRP